MVGIGAIQFQDQSPVTLLHLFGQRQFEFQTRSFFQHVVEILQLYRGASAGCEVSDGHAFAVLLKDDRVGETAPEGIAQGSRIGATQFGKQHGFGNHADG